jgi:uncharacterized protein YraI
MSFSSRSLGAVLSIAAVAAVTMASSGRAQQDPPSAGQEAAPQTATEAKPPQSPTPDAQTPASSIPAASTPAASTPAPQVPSARTAGASPSTGASPSRRPAQFAQARPGSGRSAVVNATVNLRSGPGTDSDIVTTIPAGSTVRVADCGEWCAVTWNGHSGYAIARNLGLGAQRQARMYPGQPGYTEDYEVEPPTVYGLPGYYGPPAVVYGPAYYGPRVYYGPGWGWRRHWW